MQLVEYELMRPAEIAKERSRHPLVFIPLGPLEWHGPHLPLGTDALHAHAVAVRAARRVGGVVLPTYFTGTDTVRPSGPGPQSLAALGFTGDERIVGMDFPGNSVRSLYFEEGAFAVTVREILRFLKADGYKLLVIVNGHGAPNQKRALQRLAAEESEHPHVQVVYMMPTAPMTSESSDTGHAGRIETSIMMALAPESVDLTPLPPGEVSLRYRDYGIVDGRAFDGEPTPNFTLRRDADPRSASQELGRTALEAEVAHLADLVRAHLRSMRKNEGDMRDAKG